MSSYIKELADRLNSLENQIQQPHAPSQGYDFGGVAEHGLGDAPTPSQFSRKRTHSMSESFQDQYGRPNWSGQDRGTDYTCDDPNLYLLTTQDYPLNGITATTDPRASFGDIILSGNIITETNEATIKA